MACDNPAMAETLAGVLRRTIAEELVSLQSISEAAAGTSRATGRWTPKEELGHLIDSAANNHIRFVRAALDGSFEGSGYAQNEWVDLHGYRGIPWSDLVEFWRRYNELLAHLIERIPEGKLDSPCRIGDGEPVTLRFVIEDYVRHLRHHTGQIAAR
jgi:hypothetical protein